MTQTNTIGGGFKIIKGIKLTLLLLILGTFVMTNVSAARQYDLHEAVVNSDLDQVRRLLQKGADINQLGPRRYGYGSALHLAVREGQLDIARLLIDWGAEVDLLDSRDFTPLHNAAWNGNLEMTRLLLDAGADIEASTYDGDTPLSLAQNNDQAGVAKFLQAKLKPSTTSETKVDTQAASDSTAIDITGTYVSEITSHGHPGGGPQQDKIVLLIEQHGNTITGTDSSGKADIRGTRTGDTIKIEFWAPFWSYGAYAEWKVNADGTQLEGSWKDKHTGYGIWNLTKIESDTAPVLDISGTYTNTELTYPSSVPHHFHSYFFGDGSNLKITIKQSGNAITGVISGEHPGEFTGVIKGREITIESSMYSLYNDFISGKGTWLVNNDGEALTGSYRLKSSSFGNLMGRWNYGDLIGNWNFRKMESVADSIDISGTYIVETTASAIIQASKPVKFVKNMNGKLIVLKQTGNTITGSANTQSDWLTGAGEIKGTREGNLINFYIFGTDATGYSEIVGSWEINADATHLEGKWHTDDGYAPSGKWNLTKIE